MIVTGDHVVQWVEEQLDITIDLRGAVGVGWMQDGHLAQGAVFYNYTGRNMYIHVACRTGYRLSPTFVAAMMDYPFTQAHVQRLTGLIPSCNEQGKALAMRLGGRLEGRMREVLDSGDLLVYGLLKRDAARWLTAAYHRRLRPIGEAHETVSA